MLKKNQIILEQEYAVLRSLSGYNFSVISGWKRWVATVSCSAQIEVFGHINICSYFSITHKIPQTLSNNCTCFFYEHTSPLTDFMNSHMFLESFYDELITFLTKHTLSVYLLKCFFYSSLPNRLPTWFMKNNLDMQMTMH